MDWIFSISTVSIDIEHEIFIKFALNNLIFPYLYKIT